MLKRGLPRLNYTRLRKRNGFFLIDSITAVLVLAIGLAAMAALFTYGIRYAKSASDEQKAVQIAAERVERIKVSEDSTDGIAKFAGLEELVSRINTKQPIVQLDYGNIFYVNTTILTTDDTGIKGATNVTGDEELQLVRTTVKWPQAQDQSLSVDTYVRVGTKQQIN